MTVAANPFSVAAGDVLLNIYQTNAGDPLVSGYTTVVTDLAPLLVTQAGQTLRLRFAGVDNMNFFQVGVDRVSLEVPEPSTLSLFGIAAVCLLHKRLRRKRPV